MNESLRNKLIKNEWAEDFDVDDLVKLIESHYKVSSPTYSVSRAKLVHITRTINPKTHIHYLDAIDEDGRHWMAQMTHRVEDWITYCVPWKLAPQFPVE